MFLGGWLPRVEQLLELQECRHLNPLGFLIVSQEHSLPNCAILRRMVKKRCDVRRERVGAQIYDRFRIWAQMQAIHLSSTGMKSLFFFSADSILLKHPLTNIW